MTSDTPRTDALMKPNGAMATNLLEHARQMERELNASKAEVARLRELLERLCDSVSENWDEGIANYFREEANK